MTVRPSHRILEGIWVSIVRIGLAGGLASPHLAAATAPLDSADYTFVYPNLPDPAIWSVSSQGNVTQVPVDGAGLAMADPHNSNPDNDSRFDAALGSSGGYIYNLSGRDLSTGTWTVQFTASSDPVNHSVQFDLR